MLDWLNLVIGELLITVHTRHFFATLREASTPIDPGTFDIVPSEHESVGQELEDTPALAKTFTSGSEYLCLDYGRDFASP